MLLILPSLAIVLCFTIARRRGYGRRESLIYSLLMGGVSTAGLTEGLSLAGVLTRTGLAIGWGLLAVASGCACLRLVKIPSPTNEDVKLRQSPATRIMLWACALIACPLLTIALLSPPNTWDAMTYHLPRVMHWTQQGSVSHYRTNILRQLYLNPGAEFILLHLQLLSGSDRFANALQWLAMIGSAAGVSLIARRLGVKSEGQAAAALLVMTLPMGILQASSTQNDYVVTFWLVCAAWLILEIGHTEKSSRWSIPAFGAAMGLAVLTKATAYLLGAPFCAWMAVRAVRREGLRGARRFGIALLIMLALNAGHSIRNARLFGSPLGPSTEVEAYRNESMSWAIAISNVIRNAAIHANVYPLAISQPMTRLVTQWHYKLGAEPFDSRTTISDGILIAEHPHHEDYAGSGFHVVLILLLLTWAILRQGNGQESRRVYAICILADAILFCLYLKWQPWHVRLHLPLLVLGVAPVGWLLDRSGMGRTISFGAGVLFFLLAVHPLIFNDLRPLVGKGNVFQTDRLSLMFAGRKGRLAGYQRAAEHVQSQSCRVAALAWGEDDWEYPLWVMLNRGGLGSYRIVHWNVTNESMRAPLGATDMLESECMSVLEGEGRSQRAQPAGKIGS